MAKLVNSISTYEESNKQVVSENRFAACEQVVDTLVQEGLPKAFNPDNYIQKIAKNFNLTAQEARTCLKLAIKQLELKEQKTEDKTEILNAQVGYYYPSQSKQAELSSCNKKDGMDNLSAYAAYNQMMFGLKRA